MTFTGHSPPPLLLRLSLNRNDANGKVGTDHAAKITSGTFIAIIYANYAISFAIGLGRLVKKVLRTKLDTEATSLTPLSYHMNLTML